MAAANKSAVLIDLASLQAIAANGGIQIDFQQLRDKLTGDATLVRATAYGTEHEGQPSPLLDLGGLSRAGYKLVTKRLRRRDDGTLYASVHVEMTVDALDLTPYIDRLTLVTTDPDFVPLIEAVAAPRAFGCRSWPAARVAANRWPPRPTRRWSWTTCCPASCGASARGGTAAAPRRRAPHPAKRRGRGSPIDPDEEPRPRRAAPPPPPPPSKPPPTPPPAPAPEPAPAQPPAAPPARRERLTALPGERLSGRAGPQTDAPD